MTAPAETIKNLRSTVLLAELVKLLPQKTQESLESTFPNIEETTLFGADFKEDRKKFNKDLYKSLYRKYTKKQSDNIMIISEAMDLGTLMDTHFHSPKSKSWRFSSRDDSPLDPAVYDLFFRHLKSATYLSLSLTDDTIAKKLQNLLNGKNSITTLKIEGHTKPELLDNIDLTTTRISSLYFRNIDVSPQIMEEFKFPSQIKELYILLDSLRDPEGVFLVLNEQLEGKLEYFYLSSEKTNFSKKALSALADFTKGIETLYVASLDMTVEDALILANSKKKLWNEKQWEGQHRIMIGWPSFFPILGELRQMEEYSKFIEWLE